MRTAIVVDPCSTSATAFLFSPYHRNRRMRSAERCVGTKWQRLKKKKKEQQTLPPAGVPMDRCLPRRGERSKASVADKEEYDVQWPDPPRGNDM